MQQNHYPLRYRQITKSFAISVKDIITLLEVVYIGKKEQKGVWDQNHTDEQGFYCHSLG